MAKRIIDVSVHNGTINWELAKGEIDGAIIRCGYGDDLPAQDDKQFARNLSECERLGIPKGVYLYSYATSDAQAKSELSHILRLIKGHKFEFPIFLDVEENGTQSYAARACKIVCDGLIAAGYKAGVYSSTSWWNAYLTGITGYSYIKWVAQWAASCTYGGKYEFWQYSENGKVSGINGNVDMNYYYGADVTVSATQTTTKQDTAKKKTVDELAQEVINGKWGNGNDRKNKLTAAGYNYSAVQKRVNDLLAANTKNAKWEPRVGDIVIYSGQKHYVSADATTPSICKGGRAKITQIYKLGTSRHPYHLIAEKGSGSTVYGWVDAGTFVKA